VARHEDIARARHTVAVIGGTGALGFGLSVRWAIAGVPILIGSRDAGRAAEAAERAQERARAGGAADPRVEGLQNEDAAARASTVVLAVPFRAQSENLNNLRGALQPQTILIDATVPLAAAIGGRATRTLGVWQGSAAQQAEEMVPRGVTVVSALHTVSAAALSDPSIEMDEDVLMAGDDRKAKDDAA
jgi:NADPH-dependent F420 reductase